MTKEQLAELVDQFRPFITGPDAKHADDFLMRLAEEIERQCRHRAHRVAMYAYSCLDDPGFEPPR